MAGRPAGFHLWRLATPDVGAEARCLVDVSAAVAPAALAAAWGEMTKLGEILRYYGDAAMSAASAAVFQPTSSARIAERAGFRPLASLLEDSSDSDDSSSDDDSSSSSSSDDDS